MQMMMLAITQVMRHTQHRDVSGKVFRNIRTPNLLSLTWEQPIAC